MNKNMLLLLKKYPSLAGAKKKDTLEELLQFEQSELLVYDEVFGENQRAGLRFLADACKKRKCREIVSPFVIRDADKLLCIDDAKARKVACMLVGICAANECAQSLLNALNNEKIRFVRPSIILALGNTDKPAKYLKDYIVEPGEPKHIEQETSALKKALSKTDQPTKIARLMLPKTATVTTIKRSALVAELKQKGIRFHKRGDNALDVPACELKNLRCYDEALFYIGTIGDMQSAAQKLNSFGCSEMRYRIEAGNFPINERRDIIKKISIGMSKFGYIDNPSAYSFEVRPMNNENLFAVFKDTTRFKYRVESISASINPVTAACVMQICKPYMKDNADVLDPFCGSATMLIERAQMLKPKSLIGIDISAVAIKAACANRKASGLNISLIKSDILFYSASKFDEIISNMPFGNRVSGHNSNIRLYNLFIERLDVLLKSEGVAFLYTQEKKLLRSEIKQNDIFIIVKEEVFDSGGLYPTLFIIKRK